MCLIFSQVIYLSKVHFAPSNFQSNFSLFSLFLLSTQPAPHQLSWCFPVTFRPLSGKDFNPQTTSLHWLPFPILKITQYHLHLHLFQAQSKWLQSCSLNFWFLLLVLVILMMDHVVFIELRIILVMDHVGVEARVRVLC